MKKYFFSVFIFLLLLNFAFAQSNKYGFRVGLGVSDIYQTFDGSSFSKEVRKKLNGSVNPIFSWAGNFYYNVPGNNNWHVSFAPGVMQKGYVLSPVSLSEKVSF